MSEDPQPVDLSSSRLLPLKIACLVVLVLLLWADLWSKSYMQDLLGMTTDKPTGEREVDVVDGFIKWQGAWNPGVTFGLAGNRTTEILALTIVATLALFVWFLGTRSRSTLLHVGLAMILSGALGNLYDRLQWHKVRDFILVYYEPWEFTWPNFNVADSGIVTGVILVIWDSLFGIGAKEAHAKAMLRDAEKKRRKEAKQIARDQERAEESA